MGRELIRAGAWMTLVPLAAGASCRRQEFIPVGGPSTEVVATVAGAPIHAADVAAQMGRSGVDARRALEELMTFEILARAAANQAPTSPDPVEREAQRNVKVQRLIEREIEPRLAPDAIDDSDVRALYERGKARFVHGRLVQVAVLCLFSGARMKAEPRARVEENAQKLRAFLASRPTAEAGDFDAIAKDPVWIDRKVSVTTVWQDRDHPFPPVVGRAVQSLSRPGNTTDLVGDETGYYIARYISEKPAEDISFAQAAPGIRQEMYEPWRRQRFLQLSLAMAHGHDIEVFPETFPRLAQP
jgi:hypothetical protein